MKEFNTERLLLRPLKEEDAAIVEKLAGDYEIAKTTLYIPHPYPEGAALTFIKSTKEAEENKRVISRAIILKDTNELIGTIALNLSMAFDRGELAYWVGKDYWGKGYGTEAAKVLLDYGFRSLNLNRIFAASFINNPGSYKIMEKMGLKYEATLRQHVKRFDEYQDMLYYSLLRDEYFAQ